MIIEILISIIGFFALVSLEHFFLTVNVFSIWIFFILYFYEKVKKPLVWFFLILAGIVLGVTVGIGIGTYILSGGLALFFLFLIKKFVPDDHFWGKYIPYFLSFFLFYFFRRILGDISINKVLPVIQLKEIWSFLLKAIVGTILVIFVDKFYSQLRYNEDRIKRGIGIEVRRR